MAVRKSYESVCGTYANEYDKSWIIDIDDKDYDYTELSEFINSLDPIENINKLKAMIPTKNGYHLIVSPFNVQKFLEFNKFDIHKDNPTILYIK
jgi:hypothetical protein